jgi:hypothetical protein
MLNGRAVELGRLAYFNRVNELKGYLQLPQSKLWQLDGCATLHG